MASIKINRSVRLNGLNPLAYVGQNSYTPNDYVIYQRDPTVNDWQDFYVGCIWLNQVYPSTFNVWMLVGKQSNQAKWIMFAGGSGAVTRLQAQDNNFAPPIAGTVRVIGAGPVTTTADNINTLTVNISGSVATQYTEDVGTAIPAAGNLNVFGTATHITTSGAGSTITINTGSAVAVSFPTDSGTAVPSAGVLNIIANTPATHAGRSVSFSGSGNTVTFNVTDATFNTMVGLGCGNTTMTGVANTGFGFDAGLSLTSGNDNVLIGNGTGCSITTGSDNVGLGSNVFCLNFLGGLSTGNQNTGIGDNSLFAIVSGSRNTALGSASGSAMLTTESDNIHINNVGTVGDNNIMRIGAGTGAGNFQLAKTFISGIRGITTDVNDAIAVLISSTGQLGTVSSSIRYKEDIEDMEHHSCHILDLNPVTFKYVNQASDKKQVGLIAEEVLEVMPDLVVYNKDGEVESVKYLDLIPMLLNELQKSVKRIDELEKKLK